MPGSVVEATREQWRNLLQLLTRQPERIHDLSPRKFEELIAEILAAQGFDVALTGYTRDGGKDILACKPSDFGEHLFIVECKKYTLDRPVDVSIVRQLYGVVEADRATAGMICTTSRFTSSATSFADSVKYRMSLHDYNDVNRWIALCVKRWPNIGIE